MEAGGAIHSLLLQSLLCGLGLIPRHLLGRGGLDHTHRHCLPHVTDSEPEIGKLTLACAGRIRRREKLFLAMKLKGYGILDVCKNHIRQRQLCIGHLLCQLLLIELCVLSILL